VNILRSLPFIILRIVMIPSQCLITVTVLVSPGAIPPLVVGATPSSPDWLGTALREWIGRHHRSPRRWVRRRGRAAPMPYFISPSGHFSAITVTAITLVSHAMAGVRRCWRSG